VLLAKGGTETREIKQLYCDRVFVGKELCREEPRAVLAEPKQGA
jgi:hypothetical protein